MNNQTVMTGNGSVSTQNFNVPAETDLITLAEEPGSSATGNQASAAEDFLDLDVFDDDHELASAVNETGTEEIRPGDGTRGTVLRSSGALRADPGFKEESENAAGRHLPEEASRGKVVSTEKKSAKTGWGQSTGEIMTYWKILRALPSGHKRIEKELRKQAVKKDPAAEHRKMEIVFEWKFGGDYGFSLRLYSTIENISGITRAERIGRAKIRIVTRELLSRAKVEHYSGEIEIPAADVAGRWKDKLQEDLGRIMSQVAVPRPVCSNCLELMRVKSGAHGEFWSCASFPKCRGTKRLGDL